MSDIQKISYIADGYFSVYKPDGTKYADCGWERDAIMLCQMHPEYTYRKIKTLQPQTVTVPYLEMEPDKELKQQLILPESELQPVNLV